MIWGLQKGERKFLLLEDWRGICGGEGARIPVVLKGVLGRERGKCLNMSPSQGDDIV